VGSYGSLVSEQIEHGPRLEISLSQDGRSRLLEGLQSSHVGGLFGYVDVHDARFGGLKILSLHSEISNRCLKATLGGSENTAITVEFKHSALKGVNGKA
jgi:hypothetical protein